MRTWSEAIAMQLTHLRMQHVHLAQTVNVIRSEQLLKIEGFAQGIGA